MAMGALLLLAPSAGAFTLRSELDARKVGVQDPVHLTITVEGSGAPDGIALPSLENLDVAGGPFQSTQVSIVNGRMTQSRSFTWVLRPRAVGKAEVGAAQDARGPDRGRGGHAGVRRRVVRRRRGTPQ